MGSIWTLKDAQESLPALVEAARRGEPQQVDVEGGEAVVVVSAEVFERMSQRPKTFVEHILDAPKLPDDAQDLFDKREPFELKMREIDFD